MYVEAVSNAASVSPSQVGVSYSAGSLIFDTAVQCGSTSAASNFYTLLTSQNGIAQIFSSSNGFVFYYNGAEIDIPFPNSCRSRVPELH